MNNKFFDYNDICEEQIYFLLCYNFNPLNICQAFAVTLNQKTELRALLPTNIENYVIQNLFLFL